jgi:hypothetical protein
MNLQTFTAVDFGVVKSLQISANTPPATNNFIEHLSSYEFLHSLRLDSQDREAVDSILQVGLPDTIHTLDLYSCSIGNEFTQQYKSELHKVDHLHFFNDSTITILDVSGLSALTSFIIYSLALSSLKVDDCDALNSIQLSYNSALKDLYLDHLSAIETVISYSNSSLSGFDIGAVITLKDLEITNCPISGSLNLSTNLDLQYTAITLTSLSSITIPPIKQVIDYSLQSNQLTQSNVDNILTIAATGSAVGQGSYLNVGGASNSAPSAAGMTAYWTLTANNWTVVINTP